MTRDEGGLVKALEVKTGNGQLSENQADVYDDILGGRPVIPEGQNAADFGLEVGQPYYPDGVDFDLWDDPFEP